MAVLSSQHHIAAPQECVFDLAADFPRAAERIGAITDIEMLTDGPIGVGSRFRETRVMFKKQASETMEVVEYDPPHSYVLHAESCGCRYRTEFRFTAVPSGGTDVAVRFEATPLTFAARLMSWMMRLMLRMVRKELERDLHDLGAAAVARSRGKNGEDAQTA